MNFLQTAQRSAHNRLPCFVGFPRLSLIQHARYLTQNLVTSCLPFLIIPLRMWHCYIITDTTKQNQQIHMCYYPQYVCHSLLKSCHC